MGATLANHDAPAEPARGLFGDDIALDWVTPSFRNVPLREQLARAREDAEIAAFPARRLAAAKRVIELYRAYLDQIPEIRSGDGRLLGPTGNPSRLNALQWKQVRTPEFLEFFGDWESESGDPGLTSAVVDPATGEPVILYMGTNEDFSEQPTAEHAGFWMHESPIHASREASGIVHGRDPLGGQVMPFFVSATEDEILWVHGAPGHRVFHFAPSARLKSAIGNRGTFDPMSRGVMDSAAGLSAVDRLRLVREMNQLRSALAGGLPPLERLQSAKRLNQIRAELTGRITEADPAKDETLGRLRKLIESMGGREKAAEAISFILKEKGGFDGPIISPEAAAVKRAAETLGLTMEEVMAEFGFKRRIRTRQDRQPTPPATVQPDGEFTDDDPNSPHYRYRDTGYIGGARKFDVAAAIRHAASSGERVRVTTIDWVAMEENPRQAKQLITKSNLFGKVDWAGLKESGMDPAAGFLVDRIYASIAPEPSEDSPQARKDYAIGLESLRDRLESCKTTDQVVALVNELREEFDGVVLNAEESAEYEAIRREFDAVQQKIAAFRTQEYRLERVVSSVLSTIEGWKWNQEKRLRKKWKPDPEIDAKIEALQPDLETAEKALNDWRETHPDEVRDWVKDGQYSGHFSSKSGAQVDELSAKMGVIKARAKIRNRLENPLHRAWQIMGSRFMGVLYYRSGKGSDAFAGHIANAKNGKIANWDWAEKDTTPKQATKREVVFRLKVADSYERVGGRPIVVDSTAALKSMFGLRDVQSGNWVLDDPASAKWHVEQTAAAFSDLSDILGLPNEKIAVKGHLALAFGARGKGNAGFGGAARAHYEPIERVINLTKMGGGGCLAHEWFHAVDNLMTEAMTGAPSGARDWATENPDLLPPGALSLSMMDLRKAMTEGSYRRKQVIDYTSADYKMAQWNVDRYYGSGPSVGKTIKSAGGAQAAVLAVEAYFGPKLVDKQGRTNKKAEKNMRQWRTLAAAYWDGKEAGGRVDLEFGRTMSRYNLEAIRLDGGEDGRYWSSIKEMASRAFQSYCEDRLSDQGRRNDYLSAMADNKYYQDGLFGPVFPFPEGDERKRINAAFDAMFAAMRDHRVLDAIAALMAR